MMMQKAVQCLCDVWKAIFWVFYCSKDKSLGMCSNGAQEDIKQDKNKRDRV